MLSGGEMLVQALVDEGIRYIYGYPGGASLHIYDALFRQEKIKHILVRHEQAATHMADGFARAGGQTGVVLVTSGPGATNAITGIATAYMDSIPMLVISGQVASSLIGQDAFQETDMMGISRPIVKHNFMVKRAQDIPRIIKQAFQLANSGRPGPVVVDIPKDTTDPNLKFPYEYPKSVSMRSYKPVKKGHSGQIRKAVEQLLAAKQPIVYTGGGIILDKASQELRSLVDMLDLPITHTLMGLGAYPGEGDRFLGMLGMHGTYAANMAMHNSDFILALGARFDDRVTNKTSLFCPQAKIAHVDIDSANISKTINAHIPIVGPVKSVLQEIISLIKEKKQQYDKKERAGWWKQINQWQQLAPLSYEKSANGIIKPQRVVEALYEVTKDMDAYITSDVGQHQMFVAQYYKFANPNRWINSGGLGTMGFGFPAAMGVNFIHPDKQAICVTGEGSIQMCIQELSTCRQYDIPVKIININNQVLGMVKQWQDMQYEGRHASSYMESLPDFIKLVESYGHKGFKITEEKYLLPSLKEVFTQHAKELVFMDIYVDPAEHVYPMHIKDHAINEMWLSKTKRTPL